MYSSPELNRRVVHEQFGVGTVSAPGTIFGYPEKDVVIVEFDKSTDRAGKYVFVRVHCSRLEYVSPLEEFARLHE